MTNIINMLKMTCLMATVIGGLLATLGVLSLICG
jgi:hypothetical protein